jgi:hypothetical protein
MAHLEWLLWLEGDPDPLDAFGIACSIETDARNADARVVAARDKPWKQVEVAVAAPCGAGIENAFDLVGIARLWHHDNADTRQ